MIPDRLLALSRGGVFVPRQCGWRGDRGRGRKVLSPFAFLILIVLAFIDSRAMETWLFGDGRSRTMEI